MKISGKPSLNIRYLPENCEEYSLIYPEKTSFLPNFSAILLKTLQVGLIIRINKYPMWYEMWFE
jgi:hypothetical protein